MKTEEMPSLNEHDEAYLQTLEKLNQFKHGSPDKAVLEAEGGDFSSVEFSTSKTGELDQSYVESHDDDSTRVEFSTSKTGELDQSYVESHDDDSTRVDLSTSKTGELDQSYIESHDDDSTRVVFEPKLGDLTPEYLNEQNEVFDESVIAGDLSQKPQAIKHEHPIAPSVSRIPLDVQVKLAFLEKRTIRCCGSSVFVYNDRFGCFEELNESGCIPHNRSTEKRSVNMQS